MRRIIRFCKPLLSIALIFVTLVPLFSSCKQEPEIDLTFDKKYILSYEITEEESKQSYYLFHSDGTGVYQSSEGVVINFRYVFEGDSISCFFDSLVSGKLTSLYTLGDGTTWTSSFNYTKRKLWGTFNYPYICEDVLDEFPNYGKPLTT